MQLQLVFQVIKPQVLVSFLVKFCRKNSIFSPRKSSLNLIRFHNINNIDVSDSDPGLSLISVPCPTAHFSLRGELEDNCICNARSYQHLFFSLVPILTCTSYLDFFSCRQRQSRHSLNVCWMNDSSYLFSCVLLLPSPPLDHWQLQGIFFSIFPSNHPSVFSLVTLNTRGRGGGGGGGGVTVV